MEQFINGNDFQYNWLKNQISPEGLMIFNNVTLPATCTPNNSRLGFEYSNENGYKLYIDRNISFTGSHSGFRNLLTQGEITFNSFDSMKAFVRGLSSLYRVNRPPIFSPSPPRVLRSNNTSLNYTATSRRGRSYSFSFKYERVGDIWRAYIVSSPSYGSRATGLHSTHRLNDGRYYVCWSPEPTSLEAITVVSKMWADATAEYIDTGRSFG